MTPTRRRCAALAGSGSDQAWLFLSTNNQSH